MPKQLHIYNSLTRQKEKFEPINPPYVGMYVCGPTVYGDPHLGHARAAVTFDVVFRYLQYLGYKVRYVSNITDVGHLEHDADEGEDKIAKKARLLQKEPMEIANYYTRRYNDAMRRMNVLPPSIQPLASGHIPEQIEMIEKILQNGYAYVSNGSVYFDLEKYSKKYHYGKLSGKKLEDLIAESRELTGTEEKKHPFDFALWKKADPKHIMRWKTKWSEGFPGWHLECSVMSTKYLGERFDIHGGGLDLQFPHHESEIAQSVAANGVEPVKYWMHNNLVTINGQKMSKSLGNFITLYELFDGEKPDDGRTLPIDRTFSPMVVRFFILQSHYRSPLDFSQKALEAAEKGYKRLMNAVKALDKIQPADQSTVNFETIIERAFDALNDDFNTPVVIAELFEGVKLINLIKDGKEKISAQDLEKVKKFYNDLVFNILGLTFEEQAGSELVNKLVDLILTIRLEAKKRKDYETADKIRAELQKLGIRVKDLKDGFEWEFV